MDTPKSSKLAAASTAEAALAQDSPVFSFISNLSPIQPVKAPPVTQGFPGLNSPPLVFTSPRLNTRSKLTSIRRAQHQEFGLCSKNSVTAVDESGNQDVQLATGEITCDEKVSHSHTSNDGPTESPEECPDQFLSDVVNAGFVDPNIQSVKRSQNVNQAPDAVTGTNESNVKDNARIIDEIAVAEMEEESQIQTPIDISMIETDKNQGDDGSSLVPHLKIESEFPVYHALTDQNHESKLEVIQQRGMLRRCLQFEDSLQKVISNQPAQNPSDVGVLESLSSVETPLNPIEGKQAETTPPMYPRDMNSSKNTPKPSGIGLHLNSIVSAGSNAVVRVLSAQHGNLSVWGKKSIHSTNPHLSDNSNTSSVSHLAQSASGNTEDNTHEIHSSMATNSSTSTLIIKSSKNSIFLVEDQSTSGNKRNNNETDGGSEEFKSSPKKKRQKLSEFSDGDGCKRCNCKKSRCLKLYCDCFAAGIYCAGPCACQGCYNRPEYEDTVLETRQQIESRNPLAFAPRVVKNINEASASTGGENGAHFTPSSARHKRGCNCKKSMCLKKYCECYQANVGCSDGCRCDGCKNIYGQKGEYGTIRKVPIEEVCSDRIEGSFVEKAVTSRKALCVNEISNPHNLTPLTPAIQSFNHGKDASETWSQSGKYFHSPESSLSFVAQYMMSPGSPRISDNTGMTPELAREIMDLVPSDQRLFYGESERVHEISTSGQSRKMGNLSSAANPEEWTKNSRMSALQWRSSPNTPMVQISGSKPRQLVELEGELSNVTQDDTPDILKDCPTPPNAIKVSSPNKKRVSPPHGRQEFGSSSSVGVRTGRKFILKAVPSFPPLTPCVDSKRIITQQNNDPRNCPDKKQ